MLGRRLRRALEINCVPNCVDLFWMLIERMSRWREAVQAFAHRRSSSMKLVVCLCGLHSVLFALFHLGFWKIFSWKRELQTASISTRAILQIANLRLIYIIVGIAVLCFLFPEDLVSTALGRAFMLGVSLFWVGRRIEQFIFLPYNRWMIHVLSFSFSLGAILFAVPLIRS